MVLTAVVGLLALSSTAQAAEMPWRTSVEDALAEAAKSDKLVMIDFSDTDCVWCDRMDSETLADTTVVTACERVIPVRVVEEMRSRSEARIEGVQLHLCWSSGDEAGRMGSRRQKSSSALIWCPGAGARGEPAQRVAAEPQDMGQPNWLASTRAATGDLAPS